MTAWASIHLLTKELWDGHPCCAFTVSKEFAGQNPNSYRALLKAIIDATTFASKAENRKEIAKAIAPQNYLNQPETVLEQILTGTYGRRLGNGEEGSQPHRFRSLPVEPVRDLDPDPDETLGTAQGRCRLCQGRGDVFLATDNTASMMKQMGLAPPDPSNKTIVVIGKPFDPAKPDDYVASFAIKRT